MSVQPVQRADYQAVAQETDSSIEEESDAVLLHPQNSVQTIQEEKKALLRKLIAQRDETIRAQALALERMTRENEKLKENIETESQKNADMESELSRMQVENLALNRTSAQLRQQQTHATTFAAYPNQTSDFYGKVMVAGKWFRQHVSFFHAGFGIGGAILCLAFAPYAIPIALGTGGVIALTYAISKLFE